MTNFIKSLVLLIDKLHSEQEPMRDIEYKYIGLVLIQIQQCQPEVRPCLQISTGSTSAALHPNRQIIDCTFKVTMDGNLPTDIFTACGAEGLVGVEYFYWTADRRAVTDPKAKDWPEVKVLGKIERLLVGGIPYPYPAT